ncbi:MAG TPA: fluoride efflux transporter CrcB [Allosphingosinicella sp.]|jgi:CrcB protein|nr:fluoride efflux transporter CrcB [Allosphingosinicella sp.]
MPALLLVMLGGAAGAGLRYEVGRLTLRHFGPGFPWGTLTVNLVGGLAMGLLVGSLMGVALTSRPAWLLLGVGVLGGFTTFSSFSFDLFAMIERGQIWIAIGYAFLSVLGALLLFVAGWGLARIWT